MSASVARLLKGKTQPAKLPMPASVRQRRATDQWRDKIWQVRHKYLLLLHPQYRELMRKTLFSIDKANLHHLADSFLMGLFTIWCFTGSVPKMEDFILADPGRTNTIGHTSWL